MNKTEQQHIERLIKMLESLKARIREIRGGEGMTIGEAIHKMEFMKLGYMRLRDQSVMEGTVLGESIKGHWKANTPMSDLYLEHIEACQLAILALQQMEAEGWTTE